MNLSRAKSGAWIFVSHSHRDLEKVREIRNELERRGHNPLLFFLKCLSDDDARLPVGLAHQRCNHKPAQGNALGFVANP
jgi:hypothetical protein